MANEQAKQILNKELTISEKDFYAALNPESFVNVRTIYGGPSSETMKVSLENSRNVAKELLSWINDKERLILTSELQLETFITNWSEVE